MANQLTSIYEMETLGETQLLLILYFYAPLEMLDIFNVFRGYKNVTFLGTNG